MPTGNTTSFDLFNFLLCSFFYFFFCHISINRRICCSAAENITSLAEKLLVSCLEIWSMVLTNILKWNDIMKDSELWYVGGNGMSNVRGLANVCWFYCWRSSFDWVQYVVWSFYPYFKKDQISYHYGKWIRMAQLTIATNLWPTVWRN